MLDLGFVRNNLTLVEEKLRQRGADPDEVLKDFHAIDQRRRGLVQKLEAANQQRNEWSKKIGALKGEERKASLSSEQQSELQNMTAAVGQLKAEIPALEEQRNSADAEMQAVLTTIPNLPHESVPVGKSEHDNVEVKRWGAPPIFDFEPKSHWDLGEQLGVLDLNRAAKITGARFALYWDLGAKLERALMNFMLDLHTGEHGYT